MALSSLWRLNTNNNKNKLIIKIMKNTSKNAELPQCDKTAVISRFSISETLDLIKEQTGLDLKLCDYFTGIKEHNKRKYFNVILSERTSESKEYDLLKRFADKYKTLSFEPNGLNRISIFINN